MTSGILALIDLTGTRDLPPCVRDLLLLKDQIEVAPDQREAEGAAELLEGACGVDEVAAPLDEVLASGDAGATQERDLRLQDEFRRLGGALLGEEAVDLAGHVDDEPRRHLAAVGQTLRQAEVVRDLERPAEAAVVAKRRELGAGDVEGPRLPAVLLHDERQRRDDVGLLGIEILDGVVDREADRAAEIQFDRIDRRHARGLDPRRGGLERLVARRLRIELQVGRGGVPRGRAIALRVVGRHRIAFIERIGAKPRGDRPARDVIRRGEQRRLGATVDRPHGTLA